MVLHSGADGVAAVGSWTAILVDRGGEPGFRNELAAHAPPLAPVTFNGVVLTGPRRTDPVIQYSWSIVVGGAARDARAHFRHATVRVDTVACVFELDFRDGVTTDMLLWEWRELFLVRGQEFASAGLTLIEYDSNYAVIGAYYAPNTFPTSLSGPSLDPGSGDFNIERLVVQADKIYGYEPACPGYFPTLISPTRGEVGADWNSAGMRS